MSSEHFRGLIENIKDGSHFLRRGAWIALVDRDPALSAPPPRVGRNPATGEEIQLRTPPDTRAITHGDDIAGILSFASYEHPGPSWEDDLGVVEVAGPIEFEQELTAVATRLAGELNAKFTRDH